MMANIGLKNKDHKLLKVLASVGYDQIKSIKTDTLKSHLTTKQHLAAVKLDQKVKSGAEN